MRSLYISRTVYNRNVYLAFKKAYNTLHRSGKSTARQHEHFYQETGCRLSKLQYDDRGYFKSAVLKFERDADYTMFMLRWA